MVAFSNTTILGESQPIARADLYVKGNTGYVGVFCATSQDLYINDSGNIGTVGTEATRTASTCYIRGLSEHIRIQTSSGIPWFWRRIVIQSKDELYHFDDTIATETQRARSFLETSGGIERPWFNLLVNGSPNTRLSGFEEQLFKGQAGTDWTDAIVAKVDTRRVTLKYDKTITIRSGNQNGTVMERKHWHPYNGNLVYEDDENGGAEASTYHSVTSKAGGGDMVVIDYILPGTGGAASDLLQLRSGTTLYWHEK